MFKAVCVCGGGGGRRGDFKGNVTEQTGSNNYTYTMLVLLL